MSDNQKSFSSYFKQAKNNLDDINESLLKHIEKIENDNVL